MSQFFNDEASKSYDEKNSKLAAISDNLHFLIRLILKDLPARARILCVGVGTGAEILSLAKEYPEWTFLGLDPSEGMLKVCRERLTQAGVMNRCELKQGYVQDAPLGENFDAALSVLVAHFVPRTERLEFFQNMSSRLKKGGYLLNAEISFDLNSKEFLSMVNNWAKVQVLMGGDPEKINAILPQTLKDVLSVLSPKETQTLLQQAGIPLPVQFFQAFMIAAWYGKKD
jgi:tRNA (cmo5U34)-methyltransferase